MKLHLDHSIINSVESILYSHKPASKLLSQTKGLIESRHVEDLV